MLLFLFSFVTITFAQDITVTGTVTDGQTREALIGVSVAVKGTTTGTFTDIDGGYSIVVPKGGVLTFSFLGYQTKEVAPGGSVMNVVMEPQDFEIETVVIVGAVMKKSDLTGAVGGVDGKVLAEKPVTTINEGLQGRVSGVRITSPGRLGDDSSIKIRGINTINTSTDPIYVVDGLVMDNFASGFNSINPNDVASIEILKDASATAIYGSRGSNGVVVITTKKGQRGEGRVNYDVWFGVQKFARTPKRMGTKDLFELRRDAAMNAYKAVKPGATEAELDAFYNNTIMGSNDVFAQYEFDAYNNNKSYDWLDEVTRTGVEQNHAVSFSGGSDKNSYYMSFGYSDVRGVMKTAEQTKYFGRINSEQQIKPWLKVGTNTSFNRTKDTKDDDNVIDGIMNRARNANPMLAIDRDVPTLNYRGVFDENNFNPIRSMQIDKDRITDRLLSSNYVNINPIKGLNFRSTLSVDYVEQKKFKYTPKTIYESIRYSLDGEAKHTRDSRTTWQWDNTISYDTSFGKHNLNGLFGTSYMRMSRNWTEANGKGFVGDDYSYYNLGASYKKNERGIGSGAVSNEMFSYILRANYNYDSRYYLTATARYDGSTKFADGNQWGLFPSFSAAWNVTNEGFMKDQTIFDQVKLRLGYGIAGNQNIDDYAYLTLYQANVSVTDAGPSTSLSPNNDRRRGTPNIKWEKQNQFNAGVDTRFLNNKIGFSMDVFMIKNKDLLMKRELATTTGYKNAIENIGEIENKGMEFTLSANIIETKDFQWNASANLSFDKNKVTKLYGDQVEYLKLDGDRNIEKEGNLFIGESRNTIYVWKSGGIAQLADMAYLNTINWNGRDVNPGDLYVVDQNGDKEITQKDRVIVGSTDPKFYGGFNTDFTWKGISLNAVFTYSYGAKKLSPYYESLASSTGTGVATTDLKSRWTPENTNAKFPRPIFKTKTTNDIKNYNPYGIGQTDFAVQDASYLRLSTLTLSYTFPKQLVEKMKLANLRVYTTGSNLFCATSYKGYDPETGDWYPPTRMYVFGLNLSF